MFHNQGKINLNKNCVDPGNIKNVMNKCQQGLVCKDNKGRTLEYDEKENRYTTYKDTETASCREEETKSTEYDKEKLSDNSLQNIKEYFEILPNYVESEPDSTPFGEKIRLRKIDRTPPKKQTIKVKQGRKCINNGDTKGMCRDMLLCQDELNDKVYNFNYEQDKYENVNMNTNALCLPKKLKSPPISEPELNKQPNYKLSKPTQLKFGDRCIPDLDKCNKDKNLICNPENKTCVNKSGGNKRRRINKKTSKNKKGGNTSLKLNLPQGPNMDCGSPFHPRWGSVNSMSKLNSLPNMNGYTFHQEGNLGFIKGGKKWSKHVGKTLKKNKNMKLSRVLSLAKKTYKK